MQETLKEIFGVFDGEKMLVSDGQAILVPGNYASKSKLLVGTQMVYRVTNEGSFFKQLNFPPSQTGIGTVIIGSDGKLKVKIDVDGRDYIFSILREFMTYFYLSIGDEVVAVYPEKLSDKGEHYCIIENKL